MNGKTQPSGDAPEPEMDVLALKFDDALVQYVGCSGRYQIFLAMLVCLVGIPTCLCSMAIMFSTGKMDYWCHVPQPLDGPTANLTKEQWYNLSIPYKNGGRQRDQCNAYYPDAKANDSWVFETLNRTTSSCSSYQYDRSTFTSTIISQWDLVCDKSYLVSLTRSIGMAGLATGGLLGGVSDKFGRRPTVIFTLFLVALATLATSLSPNLPFFATMTFFIFFIESVSYITAFTYVVELLGPRWRALVAVVMPELYGVAFMMLAGLAFVFRNWKHLYWSITPTSILVVLPLICLMPESPRWLFSQKRDEEGLKVMNILARRNGKPTPFKVKIKMEVNKSRGGVKEFISSPILVLRSGIIFYAWFVAAFTYYGLTFSLDALAGSIYLNLLVSGALEVVGNASGQLAASSRLGRRLSTCMFYVLAGLSLLLVLAVPEDKPLLVTILATFGRFCSTGFYATIYIWTAELYPTVVRNTGMSMSSAVGKIGGVCAPFVNRLALVTPWLPSVIFGVMSLLCGLLMLLLPETRNRTLPQTISEMKSMAKKEKSRPAEKATETKGFQPLKVIIGDRDNKETHSIS